MASTREYLDFVLEQQDRLDGIRTRGMMGEYLLYFEGKLVGGVYDDRLLLKPTPSALALLKEEGLEAVMELPYEGAKEMLLADVDRRELLCRLVQSIGEAIPPAKGKQPRQTGTKSAAGPGKPEEKR